LHNVAIRVNVFDVESPIRLRKKTGQKRRRKRVESERPIKAARKKRPRKRI
jgi:hypothetical protein